MQYNCNLLLLLAIKENTLLREIIYMILVAGNFLNTVSTTNSFSVYIIGSNVRFTLRNSVKLTVTVNNNTIRYDMQAFNASLPYRTT